MRMKIATLQAKYLETLMRLILTRWLGLMCLALAPVAMAQGMPGGCPEKNLLYWQAFPPGG